MTLRACKAGPVRHACGVLSAVRHPVACQSAGNSGIPRMEVWTMNPEIDDPNRIFPDQDLNLPDTDD